MKLDRISEESMNEIVKAFSEYKYEDQESLLFMQRQERHRRLYERFCSCRNKKRLVIHNQ